MFILYTFDKGFEQSSFDPECLAAQIYLNVIGVDWELSISNHVEASSNGELPVLKYGTQYISGLSSIIDFLAKKGYDLDANLNEKNKTVSYCMRGYIASKLKDILDYYRYVDESNFVQSTRPELGKILSLASRYTVPGKLVDKAKTNLKKYEQSVEVEKEYRKQLKLSTISLKYLDRIKDDKVLPPLEAKILEVARTIFKELDELLGDKKYLFETSNLSTIDVIVYSYLSHIIYPSVENSKVSDYILQHHPKLIKYTDNINQIASRIEKTPLPTTSQIFNLKNIGLYILPNSLTNYFKAWNQPQSFESKPILGPEELKLQKHRAYSVITAIIGFTAYIIFNGFLGGDEEIDEDITDYTPQQEIDYIQEEVADIEPDE